MHPSVQGLVDSFEWFDLSDEYREHVDNIRRAYHSFARLVAQETPSGPELTVALRKLREAKDATVQAVIAEARREARAIEEGKNE